MNKMFIFLIISGVILTFSIITICSAPIINKDLPSSWAYENCQIYKDKEELEGATLNERNSNKKGKTICERQKAMYSLEYASFIFDIISGFFCTFLSFLQYLNIGKNFKKNTGLIGLITGIIGFIFTFIYFVYSAYIFTNDRVPENFLIKLYPNGALYKIVDNKEIYSSSGDNDYYSVLPKYKDIGQKQYNYDSDYYKIYQKEKAIATAPGGRGCIFQHNLKIDCNYVYFQPFESYQNKYLYDKWTTTLVFSFLISICNIGLLIFGFLLFKEGDGETK